MKKEKQLKKILKDNSFIFFKLEYPTMEVQYISSISGEIELTNELLIDLINRDHNVLKSVVLAKRSNKEINVSIYFDYLLIDIKIKYINNSIEGIINNSNKFNSDRLLITSFNMPFRILNIEGDIIDKNLKTINYRKKYSKKYLNYQLKHLETNKNMKSLIEIDSSIYELWTIALRNKENKIYAICELIQDITYVKDLRNRIKTLEEKEELTGLKNKKSLIKAIAFKENISLVIIDIIDFKSFNEGITFKIGDSILELYSRRLNKCLGDIELYHLGADKFSFYLENKTKEEIIFMLKNISKKLDQFYQLPDIEISLDTKFGIACKIDTKVSPEDLLIHAEAALDFNNSNFNRDKIYFYRAISSEEIKISLELKHEIDKAIINNDFHILYQPQINSKNQELIGIEALIRWEHKEQGTIYPNDFIKIAENTNQIIKIGEIVIRSVMQQVALWQNKKVNFNRVSINISTKQLEDISFFDKINEIILETKCNPNLIAFEITESFIIGDINKSIETLNRIKNLGIDIIIDDFGTGYSSLSYLKKLPITKIKIDKSFIDDILTDYNDQGIVKAIISMSKSLKLDIIAEGVESLEQKNFLMKEECFEIQGYLYSKPITVKELADKYFK